MADHSDALVVHAAQAPGRAKLIAEFVLLYAAVPLVFRLGLLPRLPIPALVATAGVLCLVLRRDPSFECAHLFDWRSARPYAARVALQAAVTALVLLVPVWLRMPWALFAFPRQKPWLWAAVMVLYPLLSVFPQEIIWRAYLFHRFRPLFGASPVAVSAITFGFAHIVYGNWVAVLLSAAGGFLFAQTYSRTRLLLLPALEHAILGDAIFTIGLGQFFYSGKM